MESQHNRHHHHSNSWENQSYETTPPHPFFPHCVLGVCVLFLLATMHGGDVGATVWSCWKRKQVRGLFCSTWWKSRSMNDPRRHVSWVIDIHILSKQPFEQSQQQHEPRRFRLLLRYRPPALQQQQQQQQQHPPVIVMVIPHDVPVPPATTAVVVVVVVPHHHKGATAICTYYYYHPHRYHR